MVTALQQKGDSNLHLIDGATILSEQEALDRLPDTLHPDTAGYAIMAERLAPQLAALL